MAKRTNKTAPVVVAPTAAAKRTQTGPFVMPLTGKITIVAAAPKVANSKGAARYALYKNGQTVQQYITASTAKGNRAGLAKADLMWDFNHGFITVQGFTLKPLGAPTRGRGAVQQPAKPAAKGKRTKPAKPAATVGATA